MDPISLSAGLVALLAPLLSHLTGVGGTAASSAAQSAGHVIGEEAVRRATSLWDRLWPRLRDQPSAYKAVTAVASGADNEQTRAGLAREIAPLLKADPELARETAALLRDVEDQGVNIDVGAITVTGDENVVQMGGHNISIGHARDVHLGDRTER